MRQFVEPSLIKVPLSVRCTPMAKAAGSWRCHFSGARRQAHALHATSINATMNSAAATTPAARATLASGVRSTSATAQASASAASV